ncbi:hypothetical protein BKA70DRAFT_1337585 [Coprinopsis sp. MPI-PUGE-AT-0042]|nr:hypothetical protein BKA70DRAFT_1337585 [Coprinopsis sp. MPI-PUGE-AT-0042]
MAQPDTPSKMHSRDDSYYWEPVVFLVEGALFKLPKLHLAQGSQRFAEFYGLLENDSSDDDAVVAAATGSSQCTSVIPLGVTAEDFRSFLAVLYPKNAQTQANLTKEQWLSVLKLATQWHFEHMRKTAIAQLERLPLTPVEKVLLGRQFYVSEWLLSGYKRLVRQETPIAVEDAKEIGFETSLRLYLCRESQRHIEDDDYLQTTFRDDLDSLAKGLASLDFEPATPGLEPRTSEAGSQTMTSESSTAEAATQTTETEDLATKMRVKELEAELKQMQNDFNTDYSALRRNLADHERKAKESALAMGEMKERFEKERRILEDTTSESKKKLYEKEIAAARYRQERDQKMKESGDMANKVLTLDEQLTQMEKQVANTNKANAVLRDQVNHLNREVKLTTDTISRYRQERNSAKAEVTALTEKLARLQEKYSKAKASWSQSFHEQAAQRFAVGSKRPADSDLAPRLLGRSHQELYQPFKPVDRYPAPSPKRIKRL